MEKLLISPSCEERAKETEHKSAQGRNYSEAPPPMPCHPRASPPALLSARLRPKGEDKAGPVEANSLDSKKTTFPPHCQRGNGNHQQQITGSGSQLQPFLSPHSAKSSLVKPWWGFIPGYHPQSNSHPRHLRGSPLQEKSSAENPCKESTRPCKKPELDPDPRAWEPLGKMF